MDVSNFLHKWHAGCSITRAIVHLKADTRRASDTLHSTMMVKNIHHLAVNVVCIEHGI